MTVSKESWRNPEGASHEELVEMVAILRGEARNAKRKAAKANRENEALLENRWRVSWFLDNASHYLGFYVKNTPNADTRVARAADLVKRAREFLRLS